MITEIQDHITEFLRARQRLQPLRPDLAAVRSRLTGFERQARSIVEQQPVMAVFAAVGMGFLLARTVSRGLR